MRKLSNSDIPDLIAMDKCLQKRIFSLRGTDKWNGVLENLIAAEGLFMEYAQDFFNASYTMLDFF